MDRINWDQDYDKGLIEWTDRLSGIHSVDGMDGVDKMDGWTFLTGPMNWR